MFTIYIYVIFNTFLNNYYNFIIRDYKNYSCWYTLVILDAIFKLYILRLTFVALNYIMNEYYEYF